MKIRIVLLLLVTGQVPRINLFDSQTTFLYGGFMNNTKQYKVGYFDEKSDEFVVWVMCRELEWAKNAAETYSKEKPFDQWRWKVVCDSEVLADFWGGFPVVPVTYVKEFGE